MGSGEAQVFQERLHPMLVFGAQQDARRAQQDANQQKAQQQQQQKRNADVQKLVDENIGTPGWFQQEQSVKEMSDVRRKTDDFAFQNPMADIRTVASATREEKAATQRRMAKRNEIQKEIEQLRMDNNSPRSTMDQQWINVQSNKVYDMDIDDIGRGQVIGIKNHPRAYDADRGVIKSVDDIKNQYDYTGTGQPQDIGYGIQIQGNTKKLRFKTDPNGQIANETVDFVLDSDPAISQRIRWDVAREMAGVKDDSYASPEEMQKIDQVYKKIQFSDDPSVVSQVRGRVRKTLNALQQTQNIDRIKVQNKPASAGNQVTPEDVSNRMVKINKIRYAFGNDQKGDTPSADAINYLAELKGVAKYQGLPVENLELIPAKVRKSGTGPAFTDPAKLKIHVKTGVIDGEVQKEGIYEIPVNSAEFEEVLNNLWNSTSSTTKEKKITGDLLRGKTPYLDDDGEALDDDSGFLDE